MTGVLSVAPKAATRNHAYLRIPKSGTTSFMIAKLPLSHASSTSCSALLHSESMTVIS